MHHSSFNTLAYATTYSPIDGISTLSKIHFTDGTMEIVAQGGTVWSYAEDTGLAFNSRGQLYAISEGGGIHEINKNTGESTLIGETGIGVQTFGADFIGDEFITVVSSGSGSKFYSVDLNTSSSVLFLTLPGVNMRSFTIASPTSFYFVDIAAGGRLKMLNPYSGSIHDIGLVTSTHLDFGRDGNLYALAPSSVNRINPFTGVEIPLIAPIPDWVEHWMGFAIEPVVDYPVVDIVSVVSDAIYSVDKLAVGVKSYVDRSYLIDSYSSELEGSLLVQTANDDKMKNIEDFLKLRINTGAVVYVAYDRRGAATPPAWLSDGTWDRTDLSVNSSDSAASPLVVFSKRVSAGYLTLGSNHYGGDTGAKSNYFVMVK